MKQGTKIAAGDEQPDFSVLQKHVVIGIRMRFR